MPRGLFVSHGGHLESGGGGVQACTQEFRAVIEEAGIGLTTIAVDHDRRLSTRIVRQLDSTPYLRPVSPSSLNAVVEQVRRTRPDFVFLNQVALAAIASEIRGFAPAASRTVLLSHGMESTDLLHLIRARKALPLSGRTRPTADIAIGRTIRAEVATAIQLTSCVS